MLPLFSYEAYERLIREFSIEIPSLLASHPATTEFALTVERLQLHEILQTRFTVAIIGQMRAGKSTLLNSLIGRDLAPTGVKETTATINWFRYDNGGLSNIFRVNWLDGSNEERPLNEVEQWLGLGEHTAHTRYLEFFNASSFLEKAAIVDTPGTRSVIATHENNTRDFLSERLEETTLAHGGRSDAVVYVVNPVARENDLKTLLDFGGNSRLPGATAYNSLLVMQKWEHLGDNPLRDNPLQEAERKCERMRQQFAKQVSDVIPVSGLLARCLVLQEPTIWDDVALLAKTPESVLSDLLDGADFFIEDTLGVTLCQEERRDLLEKLPWIILRFAVGCSFRNSCVDGQSLQHILRKESGLERFQSILQQRFFRLSSLIKIGSVLRKALTPCDAAFLRLERVIKTRGEEQAKILHLIEQLRASDDIELLNEAADALEKSLAMLENDSKLVQQVLSRLDSLKHGLASNFQYLENDVRSLDSIDSFEGESVSANQRQVLRRLFGAQGSEPWQRLGISEKASIEDMISAAETLLSEWSGMRFKIDPRIKAVYEHGCQRLEQMLDWLENNN